jgi:hypothetical protein
VVVERLDQRDGSPCIAKVDEPSVVGKGESSGRQIAAPGRLDWTHSEGHSLLSAYAGDSESTVDPWAVSDT